MEAQRKIHLLLIIDYVLGLISTLIAFLLTKTPITWPILFLIPLIILIAEVSFKIHQVIYRHIDFVDIWRVALAVAIGHGILGSLFYRNFGMRFIVTSLAIYLCALCGSRIIFKIWFYSKSQVKQEQKEKKLRTIIVGAGSAGTMVKAEIEKHKYLQADVVGYVDDDSTKIGRTIHNTQVLGAIKDLDKVMKKYEIQQVLFAIPSAPGHLVREVNAIVKKNHAKLKVLPGVYEIIEGKVQVSSIRDVNIDDLLRRDPIVIDLGSISSYITNKVVLVTGAAGSIGSELVRQICRFHPKEVVLLDINENGLHDMHIELNHSFPQQKYSCVIANIREKNRLEEVFAWKKPQVVFHAAAHKHVPMMEHNPGEAIKNNIFGTLNVPMQSAESNVERFVLISTDKAVNPTNVMGATKRAAEKIIQALGQDSQTIFTAVRFGNVLGSNGSVVPLFKKQISEGGPITVTHPDITRYFMTIPEACQLVLQAGANATQGDVFVLDMGEPVKIAELAKTMVDLSGFTLGEDIEIEYVGLRPGEKLYEELFSDTENVSPTKHPKVFRAHLEIVDKTLLLKDIDELARSLDTKNPDVMRQKIKKVVPNYHPELGGMREEAAAACQY